MFHVSKMFILKQGVILAVFFMGCFAIAQERKVDSDFETFRQAVLSHSPNATGVTFGDQGVPVVGASSSVPMYVHYAGVPISVAVDEQSVQNRTQYSFGPAGMGEAVETTLNGTLSKIDSTQFTDKELAQIQKDAPWSVLGTDKKTLHVAGLGRQAIAQKKEVYHPIIIDHGFISCVPAPHFTLPGSSVAKPVSNKPKVPARGKK